MSNSTQHVHHRVTWEPVTQGSEIIRSSIGGYPVLPAGQRIPVCSESGCGKPMSLFLQLAMEDRFGLPFEAGSVLSVFQCIEHDDPFEELDTKSQKNDGICCPTIIGTIPTTRCSLLRETGHGNYPSARRWWTIPGW